MRSQTMIKQTLNLITTKDHQQVAVWHIIDDEVFDPVNNSDNEALDSNDFNSNTGAHKKQNLLFLHGAFSDKTVCLGIVIALKNSHTAKENRRITYRYNLFPNLDAFS